MNEQTKQKLAAFGKKTVEFLKTEYLTVGYIVAVFLCELTGVAVTSGKFYMTQPWLYMTFIAFVCLASVYLKTHGKRYILFVSALALNFMLDLAFIILYDSTGTVFDYAMINLHADAMAIVESVPISFTYVFVSAMIIALYCTLGQILKKRMPAIKHKRYASAVTSVALCAAIGANAILVYFGNYKNDSNDLSYKLYQTETGTYSNKGMIGNFYNELVRGLWFSDIKIGSLDELNDFVYAETTTPSDYHGIAEGYNVVTVLCESFEWFTFLYDAQRYPNGYARAVTETGADVQELIDNLHTLFPNLYRFYESRSTVVLNNSYSLEKTDISENKSIIGNYPMFEYINYAYPNNSVPYSLPNILKELYGVESNSFHNGRKTFYNRNEHHTHALGFESYTASTDMGMNENEGGVGERNLDSQMFETCKEQMFPTDRRFNTYITTITQHGQYAYRENLADNYKKLDSLGILPYDPDNDDANALRYYCAAGMDTDKAIGIMLDYLEENGLADKTVITLFGDHNGYYQGVSNYVKNIYSYKVDNYTELYRVPVMIKVGDLELGNRTIEKFTCVADIYPSLLDLLGITAFSNLTYGTSVFGDQTSILYSRAYDKFLTDKIYFNSLSHIIYQAPDVDERYISEINDRALSMLDKISHVNRIFAADFFAGDNEKIFFDNLKRINPLLDTDGSNGAI